MSCFGNSTSDTSDQQIFHLLQGNELCNGSDMMAGYMPCIQVCTIYKTNQGSAHHKSTINKLKTRMVKVLNANKWLMGRLRHVYKNETKSGKTVTKKVIALCVSDTESPEIYINKTVNNDFFKSDATYTHYTDIIKKYDLGMSGKQIDNDDGKLFEFGVITDEAETHICVHMCISHMIADGYTMFQIYKQLDFENVEVFSMNANRVENYDEICDKLSIIPVGIKSVDSMIKFAEATVVPTLKKGVAQKWKGKVLKQFLYKFDKHEIEKRKLQYQEECEQLDLKFVSTKKLLSF